MSRDPLAPAQFVAKRYGWGDFVRKQSSRAFVGVALFACAGSAVRRPTYTSHATTEVKVDGSVVDVPLDLLEIPYPPPPARVEVVPETTVTGAVWVDGEWGWTGKRWSWSRGYWSVPPAGARFAPWLTIRGVDGRLYMAKGVWRSADGKTDLPTPAVVVEAKGGRGAVLNADGEEEPTGRDVRAPTEREDAGP